MIQSRHEHTFEQHSRFCFVIGCAERDIQDGCNGAISLLVCTSCMLYRGACHDIYCDSKRPPADNWVHAVSSFGIM